MIVSVTFSCCGLDDEPTKEINSTSPDSQMTENNITFGLNETAVFTNLKFTATEIKESREEGVFEPKNGNVFVGIKFTVENISDEEQNISSLLLFEGYVDDVKCEYSFAASAAFDEGTIDGSLAPGKKLVGWYPLELPEDWSKIELSVKADWLSNKVAMFVFEK